MFPFFLLFCHSCFPQKRHSKCCVSPAMLICVKTSAIHPSDNDNHRCIEEKDSLPPLSATHPPLPQKLSACLCLLSSSVCLHAPTLAPASDLTSSPQQVESVTHTDTPPVEGSLCDYKAAGHRMVTNSLAERCPRNEMRSPPQRPCCCFRERGSGRCVPHSGKHCNCFYC